MAGEGWQLGQTRTRHYYLYGSYYPEKGEFATEVSP